MRVEDYLVYLVREIHSTVFATMDDLGRPVTCAIDLMDVDENGLYFLTARGKGFYDRLKKHDCIALTGMREAADSPGAGTLSCVAVSVQGRAREIGPSRLGRLFEKNPYMEKIYPGEDSRSVLTVFQIYEGTGEWFDLSRRPIERESFAFGGAERKRSGYVIDGRCDGCGLCAAKCPQGCIDVSVRPAVIDEGNCLHCGKCAEVCTRGAVSRGSAVSRGAAVS